MSVPLQPFADDAASVSVCGLTVENGREAIAVYGQANVTRDKAGLANARALLAFAEAVVRVLEGDAALPDAVAPAKKPGVVKNPFA